MTLGTWAIVKEPSLVGLIPLVLYIILSMKMTKSHTLPILICAAIGCLMAGNGPIGFGKAILTDLGGLMGWVGIIGVIGSGLSGVMSKTGVTTKLCSWLVGLFHIKTRKMAILLISAVTFLMAFAMGSGLSATIVVATFCIPIAAQFGIRPIVMSAIELFVGYAGMTLSPFSATNLGCMQITGLDYPEFVLYAAAPYVLVTTIAAVLIALIADKKYSKLPDSAFEPNYEIVASEADVADPKVTRATIAFIVTFVVCLVAMIVFKGGMNFALFYLVALTAIIAVFSKSNAYDTMDTFFKGASNFLPMMFTLILVQVMLDSIDAMGGFTALGDLCAKIIPESGGQSILMAVGTLFGAFGINGAAAAQMVVIDGVFRGMVEAAALPMGMWAMALLMGSLPSNFIFPGSVQWGVMGVVRCGDIKRMMKLCWIMSAIQLTFAMLYCFIVPAIV